MRTVLFYLIIGVLFWGCSVSTLPETKCDLIRSFTEYPDSSYFKDISCIYYEKDQLYAFDKSRGDVAVLNMETNDFYTAGDIGEGPTQVSNPTSFYVQKDTVFLLDGGSMSFKLYYKNKFIKSIPTCAYSENRFFIADDTIYTTATTDSTCYVKQSKHWKRENIHDIRLQGNILPITKDKGMNLIRNQRHLIKGGNNCLYALSNNYHIIEKYDLKTNALIECYDLSDIEPIRKTLKHINQDIGGKRISIFIQDAYWYNNNLYLLCADWEKGYHVNTILAINDESTWTPSRIYRLPYEIYTAIAIYNNQIYAANYTTNSIDIYNTTK